MENYKSEIPCVCCGENGENMNCFHHLLTRKAWPEHKDKTWNKISVCQKHHNEFHNMSIQFMACLYPGVYEFLKMNEWELSLGKWRHFNE
jgi:hypothetical protein